jgi:hypothetical protein
VHDAHVATRLKEGFDLHLAPSGYPVGELDVAREQGLADGLDSLDAQTSGAVVSTCMLDGLDGLDAQTARDGALGARGGALGGLDGLDAQTARCTGTSVRLACLCTRSSARLACHRGSDGTT